MFSQSGGCCDGSAPMCYPAGEFRPATATSASATSAGAPFYMGPDAVRVLGAHAADHRCGPGNGGMFSLDNGSGRRFLTRSRLFSDEECALLRTQPVRQGA